MNTWEKLNKEIYMKSLKKTLSAILATSLLMGTVISVNIETAAAVDNSADKT